MLAVTIKTNDNKKIHLTKLIFANKAWTVNNS